MGGGKRPNKNAKRRAREKQRKEQRRKELEALKEQQANGGSSNTALAVVKTESAEGGNSTQLVPKDVTNTVEIEYVAADISRDLEQNEAFQALQDVFDHFAKPEELLATKENKSNKKALAAGDADADTDKKAKKDEGDAKAVVKKMSKKQRRLANRLSVAELKQLVKRPDVVEVHDVTAADPRLLVYLKSYRNTVPVPRHWSLKRKYLQGKRGIEKPPFELPECIKYTGIDKVRDAFQEKESKMNSKAKARANMTGSTGKTEIDYQVLYDAFFKLKTKPKNLTSHGDLYYESKEYETKHKDFIPGQLSDTLREALGMPVRHGDGGVGGVADLYAPPYLINMQRYGPPPEFPKLKIPGLNAPIPQGASYGYNPGEWGKPPVDEFGHSRYGNVFAEEQANLHDVDTTTRWGQMMPSDEEESESETESSEEESDDESEEEDESGMETPDIASGISSVASGLDSPSSIDLRKGRTSVSSTDSEGPQTAYRIIPQTSAKVGKGELFGSTHRYVLPTGPTPKGNNSGGVVAQKRSSSSSPSGPGVAVALDPSDLEGSLTAEQLQKQYDAQGGVSSKATLDAINARKRKQPRGDDDPRKRASKSNYKF